jgi:hypothetical protein
VVLSGKSAARLVDLDVAQVHQLRVLHVRPGLNPDTEILDVAATYVDIYVRYRWRVNLCMQGDQKGKKSWSYQLTVEIVHFN